MKRAEAKAKRQHEAAIRQAEYDALTPTEKLAKNDEVIAKLAKQQSS